MTIYEHYKGGTYKLIGEAVHSETLEPLIIYEQLYKTKDYPKGTLWVRPKLHFEGMVLIDGEEAPRFKKIEE